MLVGLFVCAVVCFLLFVYIFTCDRSPSPYYSSNPQSCGKWSRWTPLFQALLGKEVLSTRKEEDEEMHADKEIKSSGD